MKISSVYHSYRHYIDVSGSIGYDDIFIGNILFNEKYRSKFLHDFYEAYPELNSFNKKGSVLNEDKLLEIIKFMNERRIRMVCLKFPFYKYKRVLREAEQKFNSLFREGANISFPRERVMSPLYFYLLRENSRKNYGYEGQVCAETQIQIDKVLRRLSQIAYNNAYNFSLSLNHRRNQHMLKFADFVASAGRRIDEYLLKPLKYYKIISPDIEEEDFKLTFGINKIEADRKERFKRI